MRDRSSNLEIVRLPPFTSRPPTPRLSDEPIAIVASPLSVRVRRLYDASCGAVFDAWMSRDAWSAWMQLRGRSRATLAPHVGGGFRLEVSDGPVIHVITGAVDELQPPHRLVLSWLHHDPGAGPSTVTVAIRPLGRTTELSLVHDRLTSRRHVAWSQRAWDRMLQRLGAYVTPQALPQAAEPEAITGALPPSPMRAVASVNRR